MAICYRYDQQKKTFIQSEEMFRDPLETELQGKDIWLLPADCTLIEPPEAKDGFDIVWNGDAWEYKEQEKEKDPEPYVPTEDEQKANVRRVRDYYLQQTDFTRLDDAPITEEEREQYKAYRVYLRDYTLEENWWLANPKTFDEWAEKDD